MSDTKKKIIQIGIQFKDEEELHTLRQRFENLVKVKGLKNPDGSKRSFNKWCRNHLLEASEREERKLVKQNQ